MIHKETQRSNQGGCKNSLVARTLWLRGVRLNLPEFTWLVSCAIVNGFYSFQCPEAMSFGYSYAVGSGELFIRLVQQKELLCKHSFRILSMC